LQRFFKGVCPFIDNVCWYKHDQTVMKVELLRLKSNATTVIKSLETNLPLWNTRNRIIDKVSQHVLMKHKEPVYLEKRNVGLGITQKMKMIKLMKGRSKWKQRSFRKKSNMMETMTNRIMKIEERYDKWHNNERHNQWQK
jgi:hypothetical protein